jgi:hypothetical protein
MEACTIMRRYIPVSLLVFLQVLCSAQDMMRPVMTPKRIVEFVNNNSKGIDDKIKALEIAEKLKLKFLPEQSAILKKYIVGELFSDEANIDAKSSLIDIFMGLSLPITVYL